MKASFPKPTPEEYMQRLGQHLCKITGCRKSRHYPHLYYRRLRKAGYYGVIEFTVVEATEDYIKVSCLLSLVVLEVNRVAEDLFGFEWEDPHLIRHSIVSSEPAFIDPCFANQSVWCFPLKAGLWARFRDKFGPRGFFMGSVRRSMNIFLFYYLSVKDLLFAPHDARIPDQYFMDIRHILACLMILGRRDEGIALLEQYMQMPEGKEQIGSCLLWHKRYAEYVYTPRYPV